MSHPRRRPLRYRGLRTAPPRRSVPASTASTTLLIAKAVLVSTLALLITGGTVLAVAHPGRYNLPGEVIVDVIFVLLAVWVDRHAIQRWRQIAARVPVDSSWQPGEDPSRPA